MGINGVNATNYYETLARKNNHISYDGESLKFDREFIEKQSEESTGFVTPLTKEDVYRILDEKVQANQDKKMSLYEMLASSYPNAKDMMYSMVGSSKLMTFDEYVREMERQLQAAQEKWLMDKETGEAKANWIESTDETQEKDSITDMQVNMLVSETVQARFPLEEVDEEGNRKEDIYLIAVDKDGIRCSKPGQDEYEWEILFTDESQYEKAIEFLNYAREFMDNFRFAAHENFWEDYLNGNMDVDGFKEFLEGTNNGIPDYSFTVGDSMYIDREKVKWAQYMNPLGTKLYTAEEMTRMLAELVEKNTAALHKLSDPYSILYKKVVDPNYNGERIFCEYPGGPLYTADEIMEVMNRNLKDAKYQAAARK